MALCTLHSPLAAPSPAHATGIRLRNELPSHVARVQGDPHFPPARVRQPDGRWSVELCRSHRLRPRPPLDRNAPSYRPWPPATPSSPHVPWSTWQVCRVSWWICLVLWAGLDPHTSVHVGWMQPLSRLMFVQRSMGAFALITSWMRMQQELKLLPSFGPLLQVRIHLEPTLILTLTLTLTSSEPRCDICPVLHPSMAFAHLLTRVWAPSPNAPGLPLDALRPRRPRLCACRLLLRTHLRGRMPRPLRQRHARVRISFDPDSGARPTFLRTTHIPAHACLPPPYRP